jgi:hypothetical protein
MSKIYKNFGVTTEQSDRDGKFQDVSTTGEKINIQNQDIDILNSLRAPNSEKALGGKTHLRDQVFTDFKRSGYTDKLSNFYADTFFELSKKDDTTPTSYYTIVTETNNTFEYKIKDGEGVYQYVTKSTYDADAGAEWDSGDNYRKIKDLIVSEKQQIKFNENTLEYINNTLPNNVSFKIEKSSTTNKFIDPLIRV